MSASQNKKQLSGAAVVVMLSTGLSRALGFVRNAVVSFFFGGAGQVDVLNAVFILPNNLRKLVAEGALSSAFIPVLTKCTLDETAANPRSRTLVANLLGFQFLLLIPFLVISVLLARPLMDTILGFRDPVQQDLAGVLFAWMINYILLVSVSAILMAVLNTHGQFAIPALAPLLFSISVIVCLFIFVPSMGIMAQVTGVLAGGVFQILIQIPSFLRLGYSLVPDFRFWRNPDFRQVLKLWGPVVLTSGVFSINEYIATYFASGMAPGSTTAMANALVFWQLPMGIFAASITTILFPRMSRCIAQGNQKDLAEAFQQGFRLLILLLVPSAVALMLLGRGAIGVALQHGAFTWEHTLLADRVLWTYSIGLLSSGLVGFFQRLFYAFHENRAPLVSALIILVVDVAASLVLIQAGLGVVALAWAHVLSSSIGVVYLGLAVRRKLGGLRLKAAGQALLAALVPASLALAGYWFIAPACDGLWRQGSSWAGFGLLLLLGVGFVGIYLVCYLLFRVEAVDFLLGKFRRRKVS